MNLKEARKLGIEYCQEHNCNYTYISFDDAMRFYLTEREDKHAVFIVTKNGSLKPHITTDYAANFHRELKRRKKNRRKNKVNINKINR